MGVRFVDWAVGVIVPDDWSDEQEQYVKLAYENGVRHGQDKVRGLMRQALGCAEAYEVKDG